MMSPAPKAILLPKLFPPDLIGIGYLLPKPLYPSIRSKPVPVPDEDCTKPHVEKKFQTIIATRDDGGFKASLTQLFGLEIGKKQSNIIRIEAEEMIYRTLKNADATFSTICEDNATREWINKMHLYRTKIYFVVGMQTLHNAHFRREVLSDASGSIELLLPLEAASLPVDVQLKASLSAGKMGKGESRLSGVFGIEVRRIKSTVRNEGEATLEDECSWSFTTERVKGAGQPTPQKICVSLDSFADEEELVSDQDSEDEDEL
jgi:hypothetical protein